MTAALLSVWKARYVCKSLPIMFVLIDLWRRGGRPAPGNGRLVQRTRLTQIHEGTGAEEETKSSGWSRCGYNKSVCSIIDLDCVKKTRVVTMVMKMLNIVHNESLNSVWTVQIMLTGGLDRNLLKIPAVKAKLPYVLCLSWIHQTFK